MKSQKILRLLAESDEAVSGEVLGGAIGVTRASVWKHINTLVGNGFVIESHGKKGYELKFPKDTPLALEPSNLRKSTIGKNVVSFITTKSTNKDAIDIAGESPEGTIVIAENQTGGRGRRGRSWVSPFGKGIYCSIILKPQIPVFKVPRLTILAGVAAGAALKKRGIAVKLKWPNDIMVNGKKIGGILSEMFVEGEEIKHVIIGIGLNVNTTKKEFPQEIKDTAGSILTETGTAASRRDILKEIIFEFNRRYEGFIKAGGELGDIRDEWDRMAYGKDQFVMITTGKEREKGRIIGLREDGVLLAEINGVIREIYAGEVI
jgi:BirA family biotin operon repressor/biotin-[acetyl-CoA-carboxylase] ligase